MNFIGFDEFLNQNNHHRKHGGFYLGRHYIRKDGYNSYYQEKNKLKYILLNRIWNNRKLRVLFIFLILALISLVIVSIILLVPLVGKLITYITNYGIQGVLDSVMEFLNKLWSGTSNSK